MLSVPPSPISTHRSSTKHTNNLLQDSIHMDKVVNVDQLPCCIVLTSLTLAARAIPIPLHMMAYQQPQETRQMVMTTAKVRVSVMAKLGLLGLCTVVVNTWGCGCTRTTSVPCGGGKEEFVCYRLLCRTFSIFQSCSCKYSNIHTRTFLNAHARKWELIS